MKITLELLKKHKACGEQLDMFRYRYPNGVDVTSETLALARVQGFNVRWLERMIPLGREKGYKAAVAPVREVYNAANNAAWKVYKAATCAEWEARDAIINVKRKVGYAATDAAEDERETAYNVAWEVYCAAVGAAGAEFDAAIAPALVAAFNSHTCEELGD